MVVPSSESPILAVDLHGLLVREALAVVTQCLNAPERYHDRVYVFITGRGKHSTDGRARIYPAIRELLRRRGVPAEADGARVVVAAGSWRVPP